MSWSGPGFVIAIIAMSTIGFMFNTWVRARHGYPVENECGGMAGRSDLDQSRAVQLLTQENERMAGQICRLEERIAVLERIVTDPADRTARAIDALR